MQLNETFEADKMPQGTGNFEPMPAGWYSANITQCELMPTKAGNGQYIKLRYDILGPTHQGRVVFGNLNIKNPNAKAEEIGRQQLGEIMRAIGLAKVTDTDQLIGGSLSIKLIIKQDEQYGPGNEIKGFKSLTENALQMPKMASAGASAPAPAAEPKKAAPPWAKGK